MKEGKGGGEGGGWMGCGRRGRGGGRREEKRQWYIVEGEGRMEDGDVYSYVAIISGVRSTSCLLTCVVNSDPLLTTRLFVTLQQRNIARTYM